MDFANGEHEKRPTDLPLCAGSVYGEWVDGWRSVESTMGVGRDELVRLAGDAASEDREVALDAIRKLRQLLSNIETSHLRDKATEHSDGPPHRHWTRHGAGKP